MKCKVTVLGKTVAQVAIRWLLQTPPVTSVLIGATKIHQLEENIGAVGWKLTEEEVRFVKLKWQIVELAIQLVTASKLLEKIKCSLASSLKTHDACFFADGQPVTIVVSYQGCIQLFLLAGYW